jgi:hypothetical protein
MNTTENNKLIAEFMGYDRGVSELMGYDTSWDWLMPVVEKIESLGVKFWVKGNTCRVYINRELAELDSNVEWNGISTEFEGFFFIYFEEKTKKEATYKAVVEFIKWYNENK